MKNRYNIEIIENFLRENKMTKSAFCKACQISLSALNNLYDGKKMRLATLIKLVKFLKVRADDLLKVK